jgi:hypothetical protein
LTIADQFTSKLADFGFNFQNIMTFVGGLVLLIIVAICCGVAVWFFSTKKKYNIHIVVWEILHGIPQITKRDVATEIFVPLRNIKLLQLKKLKTNYNKYLPIPQIKTGTNTCWYFIGEDGEWINFGPKDFNVERKRLGLKLDPTDVRNQRAALQKLLTDNYKTKKWWLEYAPYIAIGILILFLGVAAWMIADKLLDGINMNAQNLEMSKELTKMQTDLLVAMDNYKSGGSGLKGAG